MMVAHLRLALVVVVITMWSMEQFFLLLLQIFVLLCLIINGLEVILEKLDGFDNMDETISKVKTVY